MIIESIKKRKGDLIVTFEDGSSMLVEYDIYLKYHLTPSLAMDDNIFKEMQEENAFLFFKRLALKRLARMMTAFELYTYLIEKGAHKGIANQIVYDFKTKKYLDDDTYAAWYISSKSLIEGPRMITDKLKQKGVSDDLINKHLNLINERDCLTKSIAKKIKGKTNQNRQQLKLKLKRYYMQKGFSLDIVSACVNEAVSHMKIDESSLLKKDLEKLIKKSKEDINKQKIIEKLYRKGYRYDDIKHAIEAIDI